MDPRIHTIGLNTNENKIQNPISSGAVQQKFSQALKGAVENLNEIQIESDKKTEALAKGKVDNLHEVMITAQKSSVMLETTVQIQKKAIDAYNEIMRMQI